MNWMKVSWKNLLHKPWNTSLSLILAALGAGLISLLLLLNNQLQEQFDRNLAGIDLVIGAPGSPLQTVLSSMYHVDNPTGNIQIKDVKAFLNPRHPMIEKAVPLSLGDRFGKYRIVGTTPDFLSLYKLEISEGQLWEKPLEVVVGTIVAKAQGLKIGSTFQGGHGAEDHASLFKVVGLLKPSGSVADQLILTPNSSLWVAHEHEEENTDEKPDTASHPSVHDDHEHGHGHDHAHEHEHEHTPTYDQPLYTYEDKEITNILTIFKGKSGYLLTQGINDNPSLQAASPAYEINRLYEMMGSGERILRALAFIIILVSGLSIFISLYANLDERRYELALMRVMGASRTKLFLMVLFEGAILAFLGALVGLILSHLSLSMIGQWLEEAYRYTFSPWHFLIEELWLILGALALGLLAALIPAWRAGQTDIHETLTEG